MITFGSSVDQIFDALAVLLRYLHQCRVNPSSGRYRVETSDDYVKLLIEGVRVILNLAMVATTLVL